jgi:catechol 2,3-dioxygenase-like lactoylglutathione lyase family enzyme
LAAGTFGGTRLLILADPAVAAPVHCCGPDGDPVWLVPPGTHGIESFGVHQAVSDEAAFHRFYGDVLGLPEVSDRAYDFAGSTISFSWSPDAAPAAERASAGYNYLTFQVMDTVAAHEALLARGAVEEQPPSSAHTTTDSTISFILDPDGNRIEISARPDLIATAAATSTQG